MTWLRMFILLLQFSLFVGCGEVLLDGEVEVRGGVIHVSVDCSKDVLSDLELALCEQAVEDQ